MIIDASYFIGDIFLAQVGDDVSSVANNNNRLQEFIDKYEAELLVLGLGRKLCKEFYTNINPANGQIKTTVTDTKWTELLNGKDYTNDGKDFYWRGLVDKTGNSKESIIAYYVYNKYVREGLRQMTTMGMRNGQSENSDEASAIPTLVNSWRNLKKWYDGGYDNSSFQAYYHKGFLVQDFYRGRDNSNDVSLYTFLNDHKDVYTDWAFSDLGDNQNVMGI